MWGSFETIQRVGKQMKTNDQLERHFQQEGTAFAKHLAAKFRSGLPATKPHNPENNNASGIV
jgi:hypothetical protein